LVKPGKIKNSKISKLCFLTHCADETVDLGIKIGKQLKANDIVALSGNLGAGKTTLIQGITQGLGVKDAVTSPTFALIHQYQGKLLVFHIDLYRLDNFEQIHDLGIEEYFMSDGVCLIEWSDKLGKLLPSKAYNIELKYLKENERQICVSWELAALLK
jgi:tRNA threonylcarbamoyladenosine biosynthesis protein TsaE